MVRRAVDGKEGAATTDALSVTGDGQPLLCPTVIEATENPGWNNATAAMSWKFRGIYAVGSTTLATNHATPAAASKNFAARPDR